MKQIRIDTLASLLLLILISSFFADFDSNTFQIASSESFTGNQRIEEINQKNPSFASDIYSDSPIHHQNRVNSVKFSPEGKILASAGGDAIIKLWNLSLGQELDVNFTHSDSVDSLVFSPDGQRIIATDSDGSLVFWDRLTGHMIRKYTSVTFHGGPLAISPNGDQLALLGPTFFRLLNIKFDEITSKPITLPSGIGPTCILFSPNEQILVAGYAFGDSLKIWNSSTGDLIENFPLEEPVYSVDFSPNGQFLVSGGSDGNITLWDMTNRKIIRDYTGHVGIVNDVVFSPDGKVLASCSDDSTIRLWNVTSGENLEILAGHTASVYSIDFSPDGTLLASGSEDNTTRVWNVVQGVEFQVLSRHAETVNTLRFSATGETLISGGDDKEVLLWDLPISTPNPYIIQDHKGGIKSVDISSDDTMFATGGADSKVFVYEKSTRNPFPFSPLTGHSGAVLSVAFSKDNAILASAGADNNIFLWNMTDGQRIHTFSNHTEWVTSLDFSPDGQLLASGSRDKTIRLWNVSSGKELSVLRGHDYGINTIAFSPFDPTILVSGSKYIEANIIIWDISQRKPRINLTGHTREVKSVTFSPEGSIFATASYDGTISFWDTFTGECYYTSPKEPQDYIRSICYSPQHGVFASTRENEIILWKFNGIPTDFDNDGMPDHWELSVGLDHGNFWDKFLDTDGDGLINSLEYFLNSSVTVNDSDLDNMPDGWEYLGGLNPLEDDAALDSDHDGITNLYEFQTGLNPRVNDAAGDKDEDGMPNLWEFQNGLNAANKNDSFWDSDGDWVNNLQEYLGGSDPNDFWSVPLLSNSAIHISLIFLILVFCLCTGVIIRYHLHRRLIQELDAPNYKIAKQIHKSGLKDYLTYMQAVTNAEGELLKASKMYMNGDFTAAISQFRSVLSAVQRFDRPVLQAEVIFRLCQIYKDLGELSSLTSMLRLFPQFSKDSRIQAFSDMIEALKAETTKDWLQASKAWQTALSKNPDLKYYKLCRGNLVVLQGKQWLNNPTDPIPENLISQLDNWIDVHQSDKRYDKLCELYLLRTHIALASFELDKAEDWVERCLNLAEQEQLLFYLKLANKELNRYKQYKQRITAILDKEAVVSPEKQLEVIQDYLKDAFMIKEEYDT
ncbi:MAG: hypothetical protein ACFFE8_03190 [Candidatus Heimdallarchaeota archaeon]